MTIGHALSVMEHDWEKAVMNLESMSRYLRAFGIAVLLAMVAVPALRPTEARAIAPASFAHANDSGDGTQQDPEKEDEKAPGAKKSNEKKEGELRLDPELKKRIDEFMDAHKEDVQQGQPSTEPRKPVRRTTPPAPRDRRTRPTPVEAEQPGVSEPDSEPAAFEPPAELPPGETTQIDIPPSDDGVPPEGRTYKFTIKDGTYEQLVEGFSRQTGLGVIGQAPADGKVTFVSTTELSFEEAFGRVRMLLFKYKPHEPYWLVRHDTHLEVIRVNDFYRILPRERMFSSVSAYRDAGLPEDDLALVVYRPQSGSLADLRLVRDWLPDYVRVTPLEERNAVTIFALVKDIEKYLELIKFVEDIGGADPRSIEKIEINYILPSEAITKLEALMVLDGASRVRSPRGAARAKDASPLVTMPEPDVSLLADDAQGVLIVRAMQDKIEEIKELLPFVDVDTTLSGVKPVVIPVVRADPSELVDTIRQILAVYSQPGGETGAAAPSPPTRRRTRPGSHPSQAADLSDGVTLIVHPSQPAIIAIGEEEDLQQVRELVAQFDVGQVGPIRIDIAHSDATELVTTLTLVLGGTAVTRTGKASLERYKLVPDPGNQALWFTGDEQDLKKVREMVAAIDVAGQEVTLHVVPLRKREPSFVSNMLREFESGVPTPAAPSAGGKGRPSKVRGRTVTASKFTPDDENKLLYILCTIDELKEYMAFIERLEDAVVDTAVFQRIPVENVDAETAIEQLEAVLGGPGGRAEDVRYVPTDGGILVVGATKDVVDDIKVVLEEFDRPIEIEKRIFDIVYADPAEIRSAVEALLGEGTGGKPPAGRRRPGRADAKVAAPAAPSVSAEMTIVQMDTRLIVHATPQRMVEIAELIAELDVEREASTETRVYADFAPETDIGAISDLLTSMFTGSGPKAPRKAKGTPAAAPSESPRFMPMPEVGKLMVVAEPELFPRIEEMIELMRVEVEITPVELAMVDVTYADPAIVVEQISPLLEMFVRRLVARGELPATGEPDRAPPTPKPASVKRGGIRSTETGAHYHLDADVWNSRIVVAAPQVVVDYARDLIGRFDMPHDDEKTVMKTVPLEYASCAEMVKALREMAGSSSLSPRGPNTRKGGGPAEEAAAGPPLMIVEAPGGGSVVLRGLPEDVEEAFAWIKQLDVASAKGRIIKVYEVLYADIKTLATLVMNVVDQPTGPSVPGKAPRRRNAVEPIEEESLFEVTKTWVGNDIYIQADLTASTMIVATTETKMAEIDGIVAQFDRADSGLEVASVPKFTYALKHVEAVDAEFAADMVFEQLWDPPDNLPKVESAFWGDYLIVSYPDKDRFAEIEAMIRDHVDIVDPDKKEIRKKSFMPPPSTRPSELAAWIMRNHPELPIEVVDVSTMQDRTSGLEVVKAPTVPANSDRCVLPLVFARAVADTLAAGAIGQDDPRGRGDPQGDEVDPVAEDKLDPPPEEDVEPSTVDEEYVPVDEGEPIDAGEEPLPVSTDDMFRDIGRSMLDASEKESKRSSKASGFFEQGQKLRILIDDDTGAITVEGPSGVLDEIDDWVDDFKDEIKDLELPPDIRIVRVRYIDVYSAAEILEEMFNATRQQRQVLQQQQRLAQQQARQLQQQQRRQQQQPQQPGQPGQQPGQPQQRPGQRGQQPQVQIPQLPQTAVRIYPNPRDRTLILRAETNQYPTIFELLATIDQPKPMDSEFRIYKLDKLNAAEVEEVLNEFLGLGQRSRGRTTSPQPQRVGRGQPTRTTSSRGEAGGGDLPQRIMQETITGSMLGLDAGDIKLSSNEEANTIVAMAPPAALDFIGDLIKQLESEGLPERLTSYYELHYADVAEVAEYLEMHFGEGGGSGPRGLGSSRKGGGPSSTLNSPSFVSYPRLNMLTVLATEDQMSEIDGLIQRLDVSSGDDQWNHVMLVHADAGAVADKLSQMFAGSGGSSTMGGRGGRPKLGSTGGATVAFIGDEGGRMLLYSAPENLHESILDAIEKFEAEAEDRAILRTIVLTYATPSKVAEVIESAYGGSGGTTRGRSGGGGRGRTTSTQTRFTITPDDSTRRLFVLADDSMYPDIESLAKALDQPADIGFEFRIFMLQYADAREIYTIMTSLITDYIRQQGRGGSEREPFSVEVNDRTNSLIVLGSPAVFGFIEANLAKIDTPANAATPPSFLIRSLTNADATEVAQMINRLWATSQTRQRGAQGSSETPPMAEANRALNMLIVRGTKEQIDEIRREVLDPMEEEAGPVLLTESIKLEHAEPEAVADLINVIFEDKKRAFQSLGNVGKTMPLDFTVVVTPDVSTRQVIVQAGKENMELVKARIAELDREDVAASLATDIRIYRPQYADSSAVAEIVNNWGRMKSSGSAGGKGGSAGAVVQAVAEPLTRSVVVTTTGSYHLIISDLLERLDVESNFATEIHRVQLAHADADQLAKSLQDTFRADSSSKGTSNAVQVFPELGTNSLLVSCNMIQWGYVLPLIESLDVSGIADQQREIRIVSLLYADAMELQGAMEEYLRKRSGRGGGGAGELAGDMRVSVLEQSNAVVLSGDKEEVDQLEATVRALDEAGIDNSVPKIIRLEHAKVSHVLPTIQEMFVNQSSGGRGGKKAPIIVANDAGNFLIIRASVGDRAAIEGMVASLDRDDIPVDKPFRVIQIATGINVTDMAEQIEQAVNEGAAAMSSSGGEPLHLTASADTRSHSIILAGSPVLITQAEEMIHTLEEMGPAGGMAMRIIDLNQVPAEDVERLIQQLKGEDAGGGSTRSRTGASRSRSGSSSGSSSGSRPRSRTRRP